MGEQKMKPTLKVGWLVAVTVKPGTAPLPCYVGKIQALDEQGLRLTTVDWMTGTLIGWDVYVPLANVDSALVCTGEHDAPAFADAAGTWQDQMNKQRRGEQKAKSPLSDPLKS